MPRIRRAYQSDVNDPLRKSSTASEGGNLAALVGVVDEASGITPLPAGLSRRSPAAAATKRGHGALGPAGRRRWAP